MSKKPDRSIQKTQHERELDPESGKMVSVTRTEIKSASWQGPLPDPSSLREFNDIVPGLAEKIVSEFQTEAAHRRDFEKTALKASIRTDIFSRISALVFAISALIVAGYCAFLGLPTAAIAIGGVTIAAVVSAFIWGRSRDSE
jgi:uncharacterized membrane protein